MSFDPNSPRYRTCCSCCHVKTCTIIFGVLEAIGLAGQMIQYLTTGQASKGAVIGGIVLFAAGILVLVLLFMGVYKESGSLLLPHLIFQGLSIGMLVLLIILLTTMGLAAVGIQSQRRGGESDDNASNIKSDDQNTILILAYIIFGLVIVLQVWYFVVVFKCYRYFKDKERSAYAAPIQMVPAAAPGTYKA